MTARKFTSPDSESTPADEQVTPADVRERDEQVTPADVRERQEYDAWRKQRYAEKIRKEEVEAARERGEYASAEERIRVESSGETANDPNGGDIVYIQNAVPDGNGGVKEVKHGPMSRAEWAKYSVEKGL